MRALGQALWAVRMGQQATLEIGCQPSRLEVCEFVRWESLPREVINKESIVKNIQQLSDSEVIEQLRALYAANGLDLEPVAYLAEIHRQARHASRGRSGSRANMTLRELLEYELNPLRQFWLKRPNCGEALCPICQGVGFLDFQPGVGGPCQRRCNTCMPPAAVHLQGIVLCDGDADEAMELEDWELPE